MTNNSTIESIDLMLRELRGIKHALASGQVAEATISTDVHDVWSEVHQIGNEVRMQCFDHKKHAGNTGSKYAR